MLTKLISYLPENLQFSIVRRIYYTPAKRKTKNEFDLILHPFEKHFLKGKKNIVLYQWKNPRSDKVAILVHGWESRAGNMSNFINPLLDKGWNVIAFDGPAHGESDGRQTDLFEFADAIDKVFNYSEENQYKTVVVIAHSFGAGATVQSLLEHKEHHIDKLFLISPLLQFSDTIDRICSLLHLKTAIRKKLEHDIETNFGKPLADFNLTKLPSLNIANTVYLFHDEMDPVIDYKITQKMAPVWKNSSFYLTHDLGHYRILKDATVIKSILQLIN